MDSTFNHVYSRALAEAKRELTEVGCQIEHFEKRKSQLEAVIANLLPLLPQASPTLQFPDVHSESKSIPVVPQPIWKSIVLAINEKGDCFTVKDAIEALDRIGRPVESPNRFQIVRNVLKKKVENFEQVDQSSYRIRGKQKEATPEEAAS